MAEPHLISGSRIDDAHPLAVEFRNVLPVPMVTQEATPTTGTQGRRPVGVPHTPVTLAAASAPSRAVRVQALRTNTDLVAIGLSNAVRSGPAGSETGDQLLPGQSACYAISNAQLLWLDANVANEGVTYTLVV